MSKTIYFVRHGESMYNKWRRESFRKPCVLCCVCDPMLFDASLSPAGEAQVRLLHDTLRDNDEWLEEIELVVTSPLQRAIETCLGAFFPESSYIMTPDKWDGPDGGGGGGGGGGDGGGGGGDDDACTAPVTVGLTTTTQHSYGTAPLCCVLPREALDTSCDVGTSTSELVKK